MLYNAAFVQLLNIYLRIVQTKGTLSNIAVQFAKATKNIQHGQESAL